MGRSAINIGTSVVGVEGTNIGAGTGLYACIAPSNNINFKSLTSAGSIAISSSETEIQISGGSGTVTAANGVNNRVATFSSATALNGEANLTFDGTNLTGATNIKIAGYVVLDNVTDIEYHSVKITLSTAQILTLSTVPITIIPAPGVNKVINVISGTLWKGINGTSYTVNVNEISVQYITANDILGKFPTSVSGTAELGRTYQKSTTEFDTKDNDGIELRIPATNPTNNGATITIHLEYTITTHP